MPKKPKGPKGPPLPEALSNQTKQLSDVLIDGDDLSCALIGATFVDHVLGSLLQSYLVDGNTAKGLLQPGEALGDFGSRRAYSLTPVDASTAPLA